MRIPLDVEKLIESLPNRKRIEKSGEVYLVGGTVRDFLLGKIPRDFDLVVKGRAIDFIKKLNLRRGKLVELSKEEDEYRLVLGKDLWLDIAGMKGETLKDDLKNRDFTVNSLAVPLGNGNYIIDYTGGLRDIEEKKIRAIRKRNLREDPLRLLRAFRFMSELAFEIDEKTLKWISSLKKEISQPKAERIRYELLLLFSGKRLSESLWKMDEVSFLTELIPELLPLRNTCQKYYEEQNLLYHTLKCIENLDLLVRGEMENPLREFENYYGDFIADDKKRALFLLGTLFHDIGKPDTLTRDAEGRTHFHGHDRRGEVITRNILERLRFSKAERILVGQVVRLHMYPHLLAREGEKVTDRALFRYLRKTGELAFPLILFAYADALASPSDGRGVLGHVVFARKLAQFIEKKKERAAKKRLVTGDDLIALGLKPGPVFRVILEEMEELQAIGRITDRQEALQVLREVAKKHLSSRAPSGS